MTPLPPTPPFGSGEVKSPPRLGGKFTPERGKSQADGAEAASAARALRRFQLRRDGDTEGGVALASLRKKSLEGPGDVLNMVSPTKCVINRASS